MSADPEAPIQLEIDRLKPLSWERRAESLSTGGDLERSGLAPSSVAAVREYFDTHRDSKEPPWRLYDEEFEGVWLHEYVDLGAQGWVFRGEMSFERPVAIKVARESRFEEAIAVSFNESERSAEVWPGKIWHPSLLPLVAAGTIPAAPGQGQVFDWLAWPWIEGVELAEWPKQQQGEAVQVFRDALRHASELAGALVAMHRGGRFHRDIKSNNLIVSEDRAFLIDFGSAKTSAEVGVGNHQVVDEEDTNYDASARDVHMLAGSLGSMATALPSLAAEYRPIHDALVSLLEQVTKDDGRIGEAERLPSEEFCTALSHVLSAVPTLRTSS